MKNILIAIFTIISLFSFSQTTLDQKVFDKVNEYRLSIGLNVLVWDTTCYKSSDIQSTYLKSKVNLASHSNPLYPNVSDRYGASGGSGYLTIGEVVALYNNNYKVSDSLAEEKLATNIVNGWKCSPDHNKIITSPKFKFAGTSTQLIKSSPGIKTWYHFDVYSVMVLVDNK
jgi:uncharacterized protein YkwD